MVAARGGLYAYLVLALGIAAAVFRDFLLFDKLYLFNDIGSDTVNAFYPRLVHLAQYLRSEGIPAWSFNQGLGQNIFPNSLGNPFDLVLILLGPDRLAYGIAYVEVLKLVLGGLFFLLYLRTLGLSAYVSVIGGLLFAYSGFMIVGGSWYIFSREALYFAFALYAFERYLTAGSWVLFPVAVALIGAGATFNLYTHAVFFLCYGILRFIDHKGWDGRGAARFLFEVICLAVLGVAMGAVFLLSNIQEMLQSPRVAGEASYANKLLSISVLQLSDHKQYVTAWLRFFSNDLLGTGSQFKGWLSYLEAPLVYCGLLSLLLAPQAIARASGRRRIVYFALAAFVALIIFFPFLRYAFWAFTGNYYRVVSVFMIFVVMWFALHALAELERNSRIRRLTLLLTLAVLLLSLVYPYSSDSTLVDADLADVASVFLAVYAVLIYLSTSERGKRGALAALLAVVGVEVAYFTNITVNDRVVVGAQDFEGKTGYNDYSVEALAYLRDRDQGFFRLEKLYSSGSAMHKSINDAQIQGYRGTSSYYSFNQLNYVAFLDAVGVLHGGDEYGTRWILGLRGHSPLLALASVKYLLVKGDAKPEAVRSLYVPIARFGDIEVLEANAFLPLGFTYGHYIPAAVFAGLKPAEKEIALLSAAVIDEQDAELRATLQPVGDLGDTVSYGVHEYYRDIERRKNEALVITEHGQNLIRGTIDLRTKRLVFFSIPFDRGWSARVDGQQSVLKKINVGLMGLVVPPGRHTIELRYSPPLVPLGLMISALALFLYGYLAWRSRRLKRSGAARQAAGASA